MSLILGNGWAAVCKLDALSQIAGQSETGFFGKTRFLDDTNRMHQSALIVHADWGINPRKRWVTAARRTADGRYQVGAPELVGDTATWLDRLRQAAGPEGSVLLGLDLPLGVPTAWAKRAGVDRFTSLLPELGRGDWADFYRPAEHPDEISLQRPFYPQRPGGTSRQQLVDGLGLSNADQLFRVCDRATDTRSAASPLFWTLGAKQVGKAAISAWRDLLGPALRERNDVVLWPFEGTLDALLQDARIVVAESYPAEFYNHFALSFPAGPDGKRGKRVQASRAGVAPPLLAWAAENEIELAPKLEAALRDGFGPKPSGEDPFDATVGVLGMLNVLLGNRAPGEPTDPTVRHVEGWILGQLPAGPAERS